MSKPLEKYQKLDLKEALPKIHRYPLACKELALILRGVYKKVAKDLQSLIFQDILTAFRLLPQMPTRDAVLASHLLLQSVEATLPKQKRNSAVSEYKNAIVAHKRRAKARQEEKGSLLRPRIRLVRHGLHEPFPLPVLVVQGATQLPQDVLVHIFSFLDMQSLVSVGLACWLWNIAASDDRLWETQYTTWFGNSNTDLMIKARNISRLVEDEAGHALSWREGFKRAYLGSSLMKLKSSRGYCGYCNRIVWLDKMKCSKEHRGLTCENQHIKPVLPSQVVDYLLDGSISMASSSDSDSDSEEGAFSRLWAYQRPLSRSQ